MCVCVCVCVFAVHSYFVLTSFLFLSTHTHSYLGLCILLSSALLRAVCAGAWVGGWITWCACVFGSHLFWSYFGKFASFEEKIFPTLAASPAKLTGGFFEIMFFDEVVTSIASLWLDSLPVPVDDHKKRIQFFHHIDCWPCPAKEGWAIELIDNPDWAMKSGQTTSSSPACPPGCSSRWWVIKHTWQLNLCFWAKMLRKPHIRQTIKSFLNHSNVK